MGWAETRGAVVGFSDTITVRLTILVAWNLLITIRIGGSAIGLAVTTTKSGNLMSESCNGGLGFLKFGVG